MFGTLRLCFFGGFGAGYSNKNCIRLLIVCAWIMPFRRQCPIVFIETPQAFAISEMVSRTLYPVVTTIGRLEGVVTRTNRLHTDPVICYPDEPLRVVVHRMADTGRTQLPVIDDPESRKLVGLLSLDDLLKARVRNLDEERRRERVLRIRVPFKRPAPDVPS
jgi:hypothetical protein